MRTDAIAPLTAAVLWGGMYVVSKWGFGSIPPLTLSFLRIAVAVPVLLAVVRISKPRRSFDRRDRRGFAVLGCWVAVTLATQFVGTDLTTASQGALFTVATPLFTLALGVAVLNETLTRRTIAGTVLAGVGTVTVLAGQYDLAAIAASRVAGVLMLFVASAGWAAYTVYGKPLVRRYSALEAATYSTLAAVPLLAAPAAIELAVLGRSPASLPATPAVIGAVCYLGIVSTAAAWYLWYKGLETFEAGAVAAFFFAQPLVGAALGAILLGEEVGAPFVGGGLLMAVGIYLVGTAPATRAVEETSPGD